MTSRPYELLARFAPNGSVVGVSARMIHTVGGRDYEQDPVPLSGATDPAFVSFASMFAAAAVAERDQLILDKDALQSQVAALTAERDGLLAQVALVTAERDAARSDAESLTESNASLTTEVGTLTSERSSLTTQLEEATTVRDNLLAQLDALLHPVGPDLSTRDGVRQFVSNARFAVETGGINVGSQFISTERDEIGHWFPRFYDALQWLAADPVALAINPQGLYPYKPKNGAPCLLSAEQVVRAYHCIAWFINSCFAAEAVLYQRLDANEPLDVIVTDTADAWPQNHFQWQA